MAPVGLKGSGFVQASAGILAPGATKMSRSLRATACGVAVFLGAVMRTIVAVLACTLSLLPGLVFGGPPVDIGGLDWVAAGHAHAGAEGPGQEQIIESVQKRYNAKVVRVSETTVDGRPALRLRLLSAQRVWSIVVDANSGRVLSGG